MLKKELWVGKKIGRGGKILILSTSTSTQIPNHKTSQKKKDDVSKQHSKQAIRQEKLRKTTKCLLTRFSYITPGGFIFHHLLTY